MNLQSNISDTLAAAIDAERLRRGGSVRSIRAFAIVLLEEAVGLGKPRSEAVTVQRKGMDICDECEAGRHCSNAAVTLKSVDTKTHEHVEWLCGCNCAGAAAIAELEADAVEEGAIAEMELPPPDDLDEAITADPVPDWPDRSLPQYEYICADCHQGRHCGGAVTVSDGVRWSCICNIGACSAPF